VRKLIAGDELADGIGSLVLGHGGPVANFQGECRFSGGSFVMFQVARSSWKSAAPADAGIAKVPTRFSHVA
jgi:hypothetical protein